MDAEPKAGNTSPISTVLDKAHAATFHTSRIKNVLMLNTADSKELAQSEMAVLTAHSPFDVQ